MTNEKVFNILVPLDVILDTVIATVFRIDQNKAYELLKNGYHNRRSDFFSGIDKKEFDALYASRDINTLLRSQLTNIFVVINDIILSVAQKSIHEPYVEKSIVTINTYPYKLTSEQKKLFVDAVFYKIGRLCSVNLEYISDEELTPSFIKDRYNVFFMYKYDHWLELHTKEFEKIRIPEVQLFAPAISFTHDLTDELLRDLLNENKTHPFKQLKFALAPFVDLQLLDVNVFSVYNPKAIENSLESNAS